MTPLQITEFSSEAALSTIERGPSMAVHGKVQAAVEARDHTIRNFLERPRNVSVLTWDLTQAQGSIIQTYNIPDVIFTTSMTLSKVADFRFFKCDVVFRFVMNMNRFDTGMLCAFVVPFPTIASIQARTTTLTQWTGYEHVFLDAGPSPDVVIRIPFVYRQSAYDFLNDTAHPWAQLNIGVFNSLASAIGAASGEIAVFAHCENIELGVPTRQNIAPFPAPFFARSGQMTEADEQAQKGTISSTLQKVGSLASTIGGLGLGPISEAAGTVGWIAETAGNTLQSFGFSKPANEQQIMPMVQQTARDYMHFNGVDNSISLSYDARNSIDVEPLFGSDKDEMDIGYVCSKMMYIETFQWPMTAIGGTVLASYPVTPGFSAVSGAQNVIPTLMGYVASMAEYWRGTINFKLGFVANQFYTGRVCFAFLSGIYTVGAAITLSDIEACPKVYCDIRNSNSCVFSVPFAQSKPYLKVRVASRLSTTPEMTFADINTPAVSQGTVVVFVVNQLKGPESVPAIIDVNCFMGGGTDIEFGVFSCPRYIAVSQAIPLAKEKARKKPQKSREIVDLGNVAQASSEVAEGLNLKAGDVPAAHRLLSINGIGRSTDFAKIGLGERVTNLRCLTRQFSVVDEGTMPNTDLAYTIDPAYFGWDKTDIDASRYMRIARIYCCYRGSMRFKFFGLVPLDGEIPYWFVNTYMDDGNTADPPTNGPIPSPITNNIGFSYTQNLSTNPIIEISCPFYRNTFLECVTDDNCLERQKIIISPANTNEAVAYSLLAAAGDDFTFGYLIPPPALRRMV